MNRPGRLLCNSGSHEPLEAEAKQTKAKLLLSPGPATIVCNRNREIYRRGNTVLCRGTQLFVPGLGVVDGRHRLDIRTSQGRLKELSVVIPETLNR